MFGLGPSELIIIFFVVLLLFGAKRIPEIAQGIGKGIKEFKKAARDVTDDINTSVDSTPHQKNELQDKNTGDNTSRQS